jgi:magnesium-transporting ATPase (P-type)
MNIYSNGIVFPFQWLILRTKRCLFFFYFFLFFFFFFLSLCHLRKRILTCVFHKYLSTSIGLMTPGASNMLVLPSTPQQLKETPRISNKNKPIVPIVSQRVTDDHIKSWTVVCVSLYIYTWIDHIYHFTIFKRLLIFSLFIIFNLIPYELT